MKLRELHCCLAGITYKSLFIVLVDVRLIVFVIIFILCNCSAGVKPHSHGLSRCAAIVLNTSSSPILLGRNSPLAIINLVRADSCRPVSEVFQVHHGRTRLTDTSHLKQIDLSHIPDHYRPKYHSLLHEFVDKLLKSGVIRPSTSVFNSPLMLVKKPNADISKPLAEQYRLVHNYVELNKSISPCSYPLRHLYELLDEVASGKIFSVLDLSQGFFQQTLIDPHEATSFSILGYGQFTV